MLLCPRPEQDIKDHRKLCQAYEKYYYPQNEYTLKLRIVALSEQDMKNPKKVVKPMKNSSIIRMV